MYDEKRQAGFELTKLKKDWAKQKPAATLSFEGSELVHLNKTRPLNPYLNIQVDETLIEYPHIY